MWGAGGGFPFGGHFDDDNFGMRGAAHPGAFTRQFRCYPVSFIDKSELESGGKIILPPSALDTLARLNITFPMVFQLESRNARKTHCGVQEFIAEEGHANVPYWLMQNLLVEEGGMITVRNANLPNGTFVKFQPQTSDFLKISNPKAVLEATLRSFTCLTKGDTIAINYNDKTYYIDVLEVAPGDAIMIVETDVNVEFAAPADYVEPQPSANETATSSQTVDNAIRPLGSHAPGDPAARLKDRLERLRKRTPVDDDSSGDDDNKPPPKESFPGMGQTLKARAGRGLTFGAPTAARMADSEEGQEEHTDVKTPFVPFGGKGRSLR